MAGILEGLSDYASKAYDTFTQPFKDADEYILNKNIPKTKAQRAGMEIASQEQGSPTQVTKEATSPTPDKQIKPVVPDKPITPDGVNVKKDLEQSANDAASKILDESRKNQQPKYPNPVQPDAQLDEVSKSKGGYVDAFEMPDVEVSDPQGYHTADEYRSKYNTEKGRQDADFQNTNVEWWEDRAFYQGLMRWGMGVLGGEDYGTAFDNANQTYETEKSRDQRQQWAEEMSDDYTPRSIQKWLETGNEADLESYESMADEDNKRMLEREQLASRMSPEDTKKMQQLQMQNQILQNQRATQLFQWEKEDRPIQRRADLLNLQKVQSDINANQQKLTTKALQFNNGKPLTETQSKDLGYAAAMTTANEAFADSVNADDAAWLKANPGKTLADKEKSFWTDAAKAGVMGANGVWADTAAAAVDPAVRQRYQNEKMFTMNLLRKQSGATITEAEWRLVGERYFPRPGDTPEQINTKAKQRRLALAGMRASSDPTAAIALNGYNRGEFIDTMPVGGVDFVQKPDKSWWGIMKDGSLIEVKGDNKDGKQ